MTKERAKRRRPSTRSTRTTTAELPIERRWPRPSAPAESLRGRRRVEHLPRGAPCGAGSLGESHARLPWFEEPPLRVPLRRRRSDYLARWRLRGPLRCGSRLVGGAANRPSKHYRGTHVFFSFDANRRNAPHSQPTRRLRRRCRVIDTPRPAHFFPYTREYAAGKSAGRTSPVRSPMMTGVPPG